MLGLGLARKTHYLGSENVAFRRGHSSPSRLLFLVDSVGLGLVARQGRSKSFVLLVILRWMFACAFRTGHWMTFRWIPSEVKFADEGTRFVDPHCDPSNCLLSHVDAGRPVSHLSDGQSGMQIIYHTVAAFLLVRVSVCSSDATSPSTQQSLCRCLKMLLSSLPILVLAQS